MDVSEFSYEGTELFTLVARRQRRFLNRIYGSLQLALQLTRTSMLCYTVVSPHETVLKCYAKLQTI